MITASYENSTKKGEKYEKSGRPAWPSEILHCQSRTVFACFTREGNDARNIHPKRCTVS